MYIPIILHLNLCAGQQNFDSYLTFYNALLTHVYESLLSVHHIPLFSFLWPLLRQLEAQVRDKNWYNKNVWWNTLQVQMSSVWEIHFDALVMTFSIHVLPPKREKPFCNQKHAYLYQCGHSLYIVHRYPARKHVYGVYTIQYMLVLHLVIKLHVYN